MEPPHEDPRRLLSEDAHWTAPWSGGDDGGDRDKCGGSGRTDYLPAKEPGFVGTLVELEAEQPEDVDFDADQGAILVIPTVIEGARPIEPEALDTIRAMTSGR